MTKGYNSGLIQLRAEHPLYRGYVLSREGGKNFFITNVLPGERVLAQIQEEKKDYILASPVEILCPSVDRILPRCAHFNICGGCHYQHISYLRQIAIKESILLDCLKRIAKIDMPLSLPIYGKEWNYRYRASFKIKGGAIGFYRARSRDIERTVNCLLVSRKIKDLLDSIRTSITEDFSGALEIAGVDPPIAALLPDKGIANSVAAKIKNMLRESDIQCAVISPCGRCNANKGLSVSLSLCGGPYKISPLVFFQANWELNNKVLLLLKDMIDLKNKKIVDIYAGAGNFSLIFAEDAYSVTAYEENPQAVRNAKINARLRALKNCNFICSRAEDIPVNKFDLAIINPPRLGLTRKAMEKLIALQAKHIIYLSCDPATFSRDLGKLSPFYNIDSVRLIDFFPQTYHIESLGLLSRKIPL